MCCEGGEGNYTAYQKFTLKWNSTRAQGGERGDGMLKRDCELRKCG